MPAPELVLAATVFAALVLYVLFGGADFGGGVWDLLARGPRRDQQRALIEHAIGPIWEANHVWLIFVVVVLFSAFPPAFAALSVAFHVPLTLLVLGIVFRGSTFAFRSFDRDNARRRATWGLGFSLASLLAPLLLGVIVGANASGAIELRAGAVTSGYFQPWLRPFPVAVGVLTLALCAQLAAVYLAYEAGAGPLADDFRRRALVTSGAVAVVGVVCLVLARDGAPRIHARLMTDARFIPIVAAAVLAGGAGAWALARGRFGAARVLVAAQATLILFGWAAAQYPYLVVDDLTVHAAAAPARTLRLLVIVVLCGLPVLVPSLVLLFRIFKSGTRPAA